MQSNLAIANHDHVFKIPVDADDYDHVRLVFGGGGTHFAAGRVVFVVDTQSKKTKNMQR